MQQARRRGHEPTAEHAIELRHAGRDARRFLDLHVDEPQQRLRRRLRQHCHLPDDLLDELQEARLGERLSSGARDVRSAFHERAELAAAGTPSEPPTGGCTAFRARVLDGCCLCHRRTVRGRHDGVFDNSATMCSQVALKVTE